MAIRWTVYPRGLGLRLSFLHSEHLCLLSTHCLPHSTRLDVTVKECKGYSKWTRSWALPSEDVPPEWKSVSITGKLTVSRRKQHGSSGAPRKECGKVCTGVQERSKGRDRLGRRARAGPPTRAKRSVGTVSRVKVKAFPQSESASSGNKSSNTNSDPHAHRNGLYRGLKLYLDLCQQCWGGHSEPPEMSWPSRVKRHYKSFFVAIFQSSSHCRVHSRWAVVRKEWRNQNAENKGRALCWDRSLSIKQSWVMWRKRTPDKAQSRNSISTVGNRYKCKVSGSSSGWLSEILGVSPAICLLRNSPSDSDPP